ncbi:MAG TPA: hypothetical protein VHM00_18970 [Caldimonas sp.]|jgi:hypothetical protein|nr:hypothetical protein [Caldimonas sp.]HEX2543151.1 hypothetical protein [Caldimonas sp.]
MSARVWRSVALLACVPIVSGALLLGASVVSDGHRVPRELAAWKLQTGVMLCTEGTIQRGDGSWLDRVLAAGTFRCGSWAMRGQRPGPAGLVEWPTSPRR